MSIVSTILARSLETLANLKKYFEGNSSASFFMEVTKLPATGLNWFEKEIGVKDDQAKESEDFYRAVSLELAEAYTLQRDVNYLYSERKRLFQIGMDSKFDSSYYQGYIADLIAKEKLNSD
jgi:hypothetical protein